MSGKFSVTKDQPIPIEPLSADSHFNVHRYVRAVQNKLTTRRGWLGDYDYAWLCSPALPFSIGTNKPNRRRQPPFYGVDDELPLVLAMASGLQHALAMLAGLITPPIIFASSLALDTQTSAYMISASLIGCGILSLVQMSRIKLWKGYYLGTGLLSVVGTSFATLSTATAIFDAMYANGTCPSVTAADGTLTRDACPDGYGMVLGTSLICSFLEMGLSFIPPRTLQRIFPPMVTGTVIVMIGASLIGSSGIPNWGGGSNWLPRPSYKWWGSPEFIGLGFLSFVSIIITELFGSPFLKNASIIVGLAVGCIVAGATGYIDGSTITSAPSITFLWHVQFLPCICVILIFTRVHTFKIDVYPPAILPMLAVYVSTTMEAIGDVTASAEVSRLEVTGDDFDSRIQGGVLSDGFGGFISALFTVTPLSIFAQNNGVIALTRCANRTAGRWCCAFLIIFGILSKISGFFLAIPNPVLGGVTTFLFASVIVSGLRVLSFMDYTRRDRFILAAAMSFGIGDLLMPNVFTYLFDGVRNPSSGLQGLFDSITIILSTPFLVAGLVAVLLNLIIPQELPETEEDDSEGVAQVEDVEASESHKA
ncbi:permease family-domain-containing protein [Chiua virens]|nr:permease family-domain-containing protein [Chiua virens]